MTDPGSSRPKGAVRMSVLALSVAAFLIHEAVTQRAFDATLDDATAVATRVVPELIGLLELRQDVRDLAAHVRAASEAPEEERPAREEEARRLSAGLAEHVARLSQEGPSGDHIPAID